MVAWIASQVGCNVMRGLLQGREKIRFIQAMLMAGLQPMFSDLDVVWLRNPLPWVRQFAEPNVLMSSDSWDAHPEEDQLDNCCAVMGTDRDVVAVETFVGKMNVRPLKHPSTRPHIDVAIHIGTDMTRTGEVAKGAFHPHARRVTVYLALIVPQLNGHEPSASETISCCLTMFRNANQEEGMVQVGIHVFRPSALPIVEVSLTSHQICAPPMPFPI